MLVSQIELDNSKVNHTRFIRFEPVPLNQYVEQGHSVTYAALEVSPFTMQDFLEITDQSQHRQSSLNHHSAVPLTTLTQAQVVGVPVFLLKARVGEDDGSTSNLINHMLESGSIIDIGCIATLVDDQTQMVLKQAQLAADNPVVVGFALAPDWLVATSFTARMNQLNAIFSFR